ncbi:hypothetical protein AMS68_002370 [Peltaster fructicola]|uniref:ZW10 C-terminal helical domain-containing protein n=1 Tax=Peltaster fructicola TaxID=286661 RepID=A0A6H0XQ70_9PEZI|nr:hypothetical protein AMS68_002370 [Peltaster fructicola]
MSADVLSRAILRFSTDNAYPEAEEVVTAELDSTVLTGVLDALRQERDGLKQEIRALSKTTGPEVQSWIDQAKQLQNDIQKSREIARQIVKEHEDGNKLKAQVSDAMNKIQLLEREVGFESSLEDTLRLVKDSHGLLLDAQDAIVAGDVSQAYARLGTAKISVTRLNAVRDTRAVFLLRERGKQLQANLEEAVTTHWSTLLKTDANARQVTISSSNENATIEGIAKVAQDTGILERLTHKLGRDIERALLKPLLSHNQKDGSYEVIVHDNSISLQSEQAHATSQSLFTNLERVLNFLSTRLPKHALSLLFERLIPNTLSRLEEFWLEPSIPVEISHIKPFEDTIITVEHFVVHLEQLGVNGSPLQDWLNNLPKAWLTKRREVLLSEVRNLVFEGLTETKTVERVESQMIAKDDELAGQVSGGGDDDWDTAWDEGNDDAEERQAVAESKDQPNDADEDDGSAWDVDGPSEAPNSADVNEEAWGWNDEESPVQTKANVSLPQGINVPDPSTPRQPQRELTFRETYTVTAVPDGILEAVKHVISDAQTLATDEYAASTLAPAVAGLYSLPTLALAIYRATAPTAYAKLPTGNMLIYNDATRLSERLREWQAVQAKSARLRLDNDAKALDLFAKRAYGAEMDAQKTILRDLLDGAQGFSNCTAAPFKQACESAVEQTADRLHDVHREWKSILGHNALLQSLGQLLSGVTGKMITDIEDLGDIGEADSRELKGLCERLSVVKALFAQQQADGELRDMTFIYCPNWLKFQYLAEILESSLADIKYLWNDGELSLEFSSEEVIDLIKALFAESEHRRKLIGDLRRQSRR